MYVLINMSFLKFLRQLLRLLGTVSVFVSVKISCHSNVTTTTYYCYRKDLSLYMCACLLWKFLRQLPFLAKILNLF